MAHVTHRDGSMGPYSPEVLGDLIHELDASADEEHPDIAVSDGAWTLSAFASGRIVWENDEATAAGPRHATGISRSDLHRLLAAVGRGELDELEAFDWSQGYD